MWKGKSLKNRIALTAEDILPETPDWVILLYILSNVAGSLTALWPLLGMFVL